MTNERRRKSHEHEDSAKKKLFLWWICCEMFRVALKNLLDSLNLPRESKKYCSSCDYFTTHCRVWFTATTGMLSEHVKIKRFTMLRVNCNLSKYFSFLGLFATLNCNQNQDKFKLYGVVHLKCHLTSKKKKIEMQPFAIWY